MRKLNFLAVASAAAAMLLSAMPSKAQVSIGIGIGRPAPVCPYGYYDYAPYNCSPYGYYGSEWFTNGVFLGAGPWHHGGQGFYGHVDNRYDPRFGYHGPYPEHTDQRFNHFHGNEWRDGQGHAHSEADHAHFRPQGGGGGPQGGGGRPQGSGGHGNDHANDHSNDHGGHH